MKRFLCFRESWQNREKKEKKNRAGNALLWIFLLLLSIGCMTRLYEKAALAPASSGQTIFSTDRSVTSEEVQNQEAQGRNYEVKGKKLPIYCVETEKPQVALSFDAAWGNEDTMKLMEILAKHNVKVTFFMTGGWVEKYPEDVKYIFSQGHDLGNHSENHKNMSQLGEAEMKEELKKVHDKVKELTGADMKLFRPPYGDYDSRVVEAADSLGYYPIQWDIDSLDWKDYGSDAIVDKVLNHSHLGNGSIILMHNGAKYTPEALDAIITGLKSKGYQLVPISQLIKKDQFHLNHEGRQISD